MFSLPPNSCYITKTNITKINYICPISSSHAQDKMKQKQQPILRKSQNLQKKSIVKASEDGEPQDGHGPMRTQQSPMN